MTPGAASTEATLAGARSSSACAIGLFCCTPEGLSGRHCYYCRLYSYSVQTRRD
jgi:hypothetical protein